MTDDLSDFISAREPTTGRPLQGLTVLVVEDSRFACEAMRLMCLRSGARIRRADCLASAHRHLRAYRPTVLIVDLGLPDGSGLDLIRSVAGHAPRVPVLLATSGDASSEEAARAAGVDGFLPKPIESLSVFQGAILDALPPGRPVAAATGDGIDLITPDPLALRDDLAHAAGMLNGRTDEQTLDYVAQFLSGLALSAHDAPLQAAAEALVRDRHAGRSGIAPVNRITGLVRDRLATGSAF